MVVVTVSDLPSESHGLLRHFPFALHQVNELSHGLNTRWQHQLPVVVVSEKVLGLCGYKSFCVNGVASSAMCFFFYVTDYIIIIQSMFLSRCDIFRQ